MNETKRVHIECKWLKQPETPGTMIFPSDQDCRAYVVNDDGTQTELEGVRRITWTAEMGREPIATIELVGATIDAETVADVNKIARIFCPECGEGSSEGGTMTCPRECCVDHFMGAGSGAEYLRRGMVAPRKS